jgi:hypothetical protein
VVRIVVRFWSLLLVLLPALACAGTLDEYYLSRLAPQYAGSSLTGFAAAQPGEAVRSLTGVVHAAKRDWKQLEPATQKVLAKVLARPTLAGERTCTPVGGHFTVHYAVSGTDAPDLTDANSNNVPDWVETVAGVFEYVYSVEVARMGYRPPPVTGTYHVYLENLVPRSAYGFTSDDGLPVAPAVGVTSYIELDKGFTDSLFVHTSSGDFTPLQSLRITAAHEFHHAIQYGYNYYFDIPFAEMTSTFMEDEVYDSVNQLYSYLPSYLGANGTVALDDPGNGRTEYGRWIFNRFLAESQGSRTVLRAFFEKLATLPAPADGSDIPALPVLDTVLNGNLGNVFFGFTKRLFLGNWASHTGDIALILPVPSPAATRSVNGSVSAQTQVDSQATPYTFSVYKYAPAVADGQDLTITFNSLPSNVAVTAFRKSALGVTQEYPYNAGTKSILVPSFTDPDVYLLVCNNGNGDSGATVSGGFAADSVTVLDGSTLDANALTVPADSPIPVTAATTSSGKSGCFIATAAYGSYLHPKVELLRHFRDRYLLTNAPGRLFVSLYYRVSPPVADLIARHEALRLATRLMLTPLVLAVEHYWLALMLLVGGVVGAMLRKGRGVVGVAGRVSA